MVHLLFQTNDGDLKMMKSISNLSLSPLSLSLSLSCLSAEVGGAPRVCHCAPRHRFSPHCADCCCAWSTCRRWKKKKKKKGGRSGQRLPKETSERGEEGEGGRTGGRSAPWPQRRLQRRALPTSTGKSQVSSRPGMTFSGKSVFLTPLRALPRTREDGWEQLSGRVRVVFFYSAAL